jgi:hypothetical protein
MKKGISILLSLLILGTMLHFSVAKHYCSGMEVSSKISLSGKLASCGMEETTGSCPFPGEHLTSHCCDDVVVFYGISPNYTTSSLVIPEVFQYNFQVYSIPDGLPVVSSDIVKSFYTNVNPPGVLMSTNVDLSEICVFRI